MQSTIMQLFRRGPRLYKRDFGIFVPVMQKASDPIQQLFVDKIREYKSKSSGGKLVEPSPEIEKELKNDRERVMKQFNVKAGADLTKFPSFQFSDPPLETPGLVKPKNN